MAHILIVCTANICRSPLVEAILRDKLHKSGYIDWTVDSAGTWAEYERGAARLSQKIATSIGLDISEHVARMITEEMVANADLVLVMTNSHKEGLQVEFTTHRDRVFLISEMDGGRQYNVADPYGGPLEGYEDMHREVSRLLDVGFDRIVALAEATATQETA